MTYSKTTWQTKDHITAEKLNNMENGIESADSAINTLQTDVNALKAGDHLNNKTISNMTIKESTFSSKGGTFKVLGDGTVEADTIAVSDEISTNILTVDTINNKKYPKAIDRNMTITISSSATNSTTFGNGATYKSLSDFKDACPLNFNGYTVTLNIQSKLTETVSFTRFNSGALNINFNGNTLNGNINFNQNNMIYRLYGNTSDTAGGTVYGSIMPNEGYEGTGGAYAIGASYCNLVVEDMKLYAPKSTTANNCAIGCTSFARVYVKNTQFLNCHNAIKTFSGANVYVSSSKGTTASATFYAQTGSQISLGTNEQASRSGGGASTATAHNGRVYAEGVQFAGSTVSGDNTNNTPSTSTTKTKVLTSDKGDTYRLTVYNNWKKDNTVRAGNYGYGNCVGIWVFDNDISDLSSLNIKKVEVTVKRQTGGYSAAVTHTLKMHNHATVPSSAPTFRTDFSKNFSVATNTSTTITLSSSSEIAAFKKCKGFGLVPTSQTAEYYTVCSGALSVKVYYTT